MRGESYLLLLRVRTKPNLNNLAKLMANCKNFTIIFRRFYHPYTEYLSLISACY